MKFLKNVAKVVLVSAVALGAGTLAQTQEAQALTINTGNTLQLNGGAGAVTIGGTPFLDFDSGLLNFPSGSVIVANGSTGGFSSLIATNGQISDLSLSELFGGRSSFIQLFNNPTDTDDDVYFNLDGFTGISPVALPGPLDVLAGSFSGRFVNAVGQVLGDGVASVQLFDGQYTGTSSWSMTIVAGKEVPTPALIPGIAAMGMGLLRKRNKKAQEVAA